jgi:uncharacterized protein
LRQAPYIFNARHFPLNKNMNALLIAELLLLGCFTGFLAGLMGIGGSLIMVPFMSWMLEKQGVAPSLSVHAAIATSLATIMFSSLSSVRAHHKRGAVKWPVVWQLTPGILAGSFLGSWLSTSASGNILILVFSGFLFFSAFQMLLNLKPKATRELPATPGMLAAGGAIGTVSGFVGACGGFISVPFMTWCNVSVHNAVATSAALGFPIALAGTLGYVVHGWGITGMPEGSLGYLYVPALIVVAIASSTLAPVGAYVAHSLNTAQLKRAFAVLLICLGAFMVRKAFL